MDDVADVNLANGGAAIDRGRDGRVIAAVLVLTVRKPLARGIGTAAPARA
jgi:hypothetical protein